MVLTRFFVFVVSAGAPMVNCLAQQAEQTLEEKRAAIDTYLRSFEYGETFLKEPRDLAFVAVDFDDLPKAIKSQMYSKLAFIVQWESHPQTRGKALERGEMSIRIFAAADRTRDDLVEYQWVHMAQNIRVVGSRNAHRLDIDLDKLADNPELSEFGRTRVQRAIGLVENIVRMRGRTFAVEPQPFEVHIPWPDVLPDGTRFSTNPRRSIMSMDSYRWFERIDFSVHDQTLSVMFYFKPAQLMGPQDGSKWFSDEFRELVHQKARAQGKVMPQEGEPEDEIRGIDP